MKHLILDVVKNLLNSKKALLILEEQKIRRICFSNKIKIIIDYKIKSLSNLFHSCNCIKKIKFKKFNK